MYSNERKKRKIFLLIFLMFITSVVLTVSTYAWFVGTTSVSTSTFSVSIDVADELELSLDGENWETETLTINKNAIINAYTNNKNKWPTNGLSPISSNGVSDTNGRLELYQMGAITATPGGYRFISSKIDNSTDEKEGYIVFDLFIRNGQEDAYTVAYNALDDEAIYLTRTSRVVSTPAGSASPDYGLANSVRVAFMEVGRVKWDSSASSIIGINCTNTSTNTGLCTSVTPTIWEPNNTSHNSNLITYFNSVCKNRTNASTYSTTSCTTFADGSDVNTYVVKNAITSSTKTDIYDGLNTYTNTNLNNVDTFTDTMKNETDDDREPFIYLAANSVTKVRVYIYLEGQDVDNYDLISNGNLISINFGFTKDIYSDETEPTTPVIAENSLYYKVASQASSDTINFSVRSGVSGTNGVYKTTSTESGDTVYYYRGNVNNHVIFNNMCWRIIRTTETGGVKMIYNGVPSSGQCTATGTSTQIGTSAFNSTYNDNAYVGYMYGASGSSTYAATHASTNNSTIKTYIDNWYSTNFTDSSVTSKIEDTVYCNDRSTVAYDSNMINASWASSYGTLGYGTNGTLYGAINRASYYTRTPNPTLVCSNNNDKFTVSSTNGNGALTYPVGLLTLDEAVFAGFNTYASNTSDYKDTNNYLYTGQYYWTMTPGYFSSNFGYAYVGLVNGTGSVGLGDGRVNNSLGVRVAVSLANGTLVASGGNGSSSNPYVVY